MDLATPIGKLPMIGTIYQRRLEKLDIYTAEDLLFHVPFRYEDFSLISKIGNLQEGEKLTVQGKIATIKNRFARNRRFIQEASVTDETGSLDVIWFNQTYLTKLLVPETPVSLSGKIELFKKRLTLIAPAFEIISENRRTIHTGRLVPVYPETYGISSKWLRNKIHQLLLIAGEDLGEFLPRYMIEKYSLMPFRTAMESIHFPQSQEEARIARERLSFDEFFIMQLKSQMRKKEWESKRTGLPLSIAPFKKEVGLFWQSLPFSLTGAQERAVKDIFADLAFGRPMNRLLEGDVGSGKTVVAAIGMYIAFLNGFQSLLMAPTTILANQHFKTISDLLDPLGVNVEVKTGASKQKATQGEPDILVGTHALLTKSVTLKKLALVVIDEQHRFGVEQRGMLLKKGQENIFPHVLTMTATPIPRTVALTMYGNLDLSYLDEMPKGRVPIKTWVVGKDKREGAYQWISRQIIKEGAQVFVICPFIEESESQTTVKAAKKEFERLSEKVFPSQRIGLLHGKMKAKEKEGVMQEFRGHALDILVATPVVEVGIDIPGATIILIEGSERFGLAQLHQLRGRVGRSDKQSYCLLFTDTQSTGSFRRLKALEQIQVGAKLAELDLKLRGPGEVTGTSQHGIPRLKVATFSDSSLIEKTRTEVNLLLKRDPTLQKASLLKDHLKTYTIQTIEPN